MKGPSHNLEVCENKEPMCTGMPLIDWMLLLQVAHMNNPRLHLKSIAIEKIGVGP
jgi:hypothetical protein